MAAEVPLFASLSPILVGLTQTNGDIEIAISSRRPAAASSDVVVSPSETGNETVTRSVAMRRRYVNRSIHLASVLFQNNDDDDAS